MGAGWVILKQLGNGVILGSKFAIKLAATPAYILQEWLIAAMIRVIVINAHRPIQLLH